MNKRHLALATILTASTLSLTTMAPASADGAASTRNILIGAAALAGLAIESNVARKNAQAGAISGYLPDGSPVYGDGHIVTPDGNSYDSGNSGRSVSCRNGNCTLAYANQTGNGAWVIGARGNQDRSDRRQGDANEANARNRAANQDAGPDRDHNVRFAPTRDMNPGGGDR